MRQLKASSELCLC